VNWVTIFGCFGGAILIFDAGFVAGAWWKARSADPGQISIANERNGDAQH